jgi:hypothetical protein
VSQCLLDVPVGKFDALCQLLNTAAVHFVLSLGCSPLAVRLLCELLRLALQLAPVLHPLQRPRWTAFPEMSGGPNGANVREGAAGRQLCRRGGELGQPLEAAFRQHALDAARFLRGLAARLDQLRRGTGAAFGLGV